MSGPGTIFLIHHTHTDVGYTEPQHRIERWHVDFIRQALAVADRRPSFKWVCETFWGVERFLAEAGDGERDAFVEAVRRGAIGLSSSYLNFNELIGDDVLRAVTARAGRWGAGLGLDVRSAMTADINGYSWGFSQALVDAGTENLFTCIHTHHGMYPLGRQQVPFWWETPAGDRLLVWSGEHYHYGNELGLVPGAAASYLTKDECDAAMIFGDAWAVAEIRIPRYVRALAERGYPHDVVPVMASGLRNDNAPPNEAVLDQVDRWNDEHGDVVRIEMATLDDFFARLREDTSAIPVHRGDWPDWWSDGPASQPRAVRRFRQAQRDLAYLRAMVEAYADVEPIPLEAIETDLALYAEHTFSHSDAMGSPWHSLVHSIDAQKDAVATRAAAAVERALDVACEALGGAPLAPGRPLRYRVINPFDTDLQDIARLPTDHFEFNERRLDRGFEVREVGSPAVLPADLEAVPRGGEILVPLTLPPRSSRVFEVVAANGLETEAASWEPTGVLETDHVRVEWVEGRGIVRWHDRTSGRDLLKRAHPHAPFQPVYEITPAATRDEIRGTRARMGLNRKGADAARTAGAFLRAERGRRGRTSSAVTLVYDVPGTSFFEVELRAHANASRVDVAVRLHKESRWEAENLYLALPFTGGGGSQLFLGKTGAAIRPRRDQIPGTLTDFYAVQEGLCFTAPGFGLLIGTPDQHLVQLGPLAHGERLLAGDPRLDGDSGTLYAWVMTNYWETNFAADLGGFYEFRYPVLWGEALADRTAALREAALASHGLRAIRLGSDEGSGSA